MIKTINPISPSISIWNGSPVYINSGSGAQGVGNVRFNTSLQTFEVYDGYTWVAVSMSCNIGLIQEAEDILSWAGKKRNEEAELERLAKDSAVIADLVRQKREIEDKIKMVHILTKEDKLGTD